MNFMAISEFLSKSGMRKIGVGLYMFSTLSLLISQGLLDAKSYVELVQWLVLALFGGNAFEHFVKNKVAPEKPIEAAKH